MDWKIELIKVPVTDVDRAREFYERIGFKLDLDHELSDEIRFVQMTPPGSACSICLGRGLTGMKPGALDNIQVMIRDARQARQSMLEEGVECSEVDDTPWGHFVYFSDPDGNAWSLQQLPSPR